MANNKYLKGVLGLTLGMTALFVAISAESAVNSQIQVASTLVPNIKNDVFVQLSEVPQTGGLTSKITLLGASANDVVSLEYWNGSSWVNSSLNLNAQGELTTANNYVASSMNYRISLRSAKNYILGYALENGNTTVSSTALPFSVEGASGGVVLTSQKYVFNRNMTYGNRNNDVLELQKVLASMGYLTAEPNGNFGQATLSAVKKYQASVGVPATGYVGPQTRAKLNQ
ncbi:MAG TPA: peptidoglycan-binding domain-containing protein [Candidatus Binatia bacterium]|nr:peptidoglycan-binding domain-containing protein [Candidatus Binatia bacterium]